MTTSELLSTEIKKLSVLKENLSKRLAGGLTRAELVDFVVNIGDSLEVTRVAIEALEINAIKDITSIVVSEPINVDDGTAFIDIDTLPETVECIFEDGSIESLPVSWVEGSYDPDIPDTYTISGTVAGTNKRTNSQSLTASIDVTVVDVTAPVLDTAAVEDASDDTINLVFTDISDLDESAIDPASFTIGGVASTPTVTAVVIDGAAKTIDLTLSASVVDTDTPTFSYVAPSTNPIKDTAGNLLANITDQAITNNVTS